MSLDLDLRKFEVDEEEFELPAPKKARHGGAGTSSGGGLNTAQMAAMKKMLKDAVKDALPAMAAPVEYTKAKDPATEECRRS